LDGDIQSLAQGDDKDKDDAKENNDAPALNE